MDDGWMDGFPLYREKPSDNPSREVGVSKYVFRKHSRGPQQKKKKTSKQLSQNQRATVYVSPQNIAPKRDFLITELKSEKLPLGNPAGTS